MTLSFRDAADKKGRTLFWWFDGKILIINIFDFTVSWKCRKYMWLDVSLYIFGQRPKNVRSVEKIKIVSQVKVTPPNTIQLGLVEQR